MDAPLARRAIAYLKVNVPDDDPSPVVRLSGDDEFVCKKLPADLLVSYLVDERDHFSYVQRRHLRKENLSEGELHEIAIANLAALADRDLEVRSYGRLFVALMGGNFEASILLLDHLWDERFREFLPGRYGAAFPARDVLAFGDIDQPDVRDELRAVIGRVYPSGDHLLTDEVHVRVDGAWQPEASDP